MKESNTVSEEVNSSTRKVVPDGDCVFGQTFRRSIRLDTSMKRSLCLLAQTQHQWYGTKSSTLVLRKIEVRTDRGSMVGHNDRADSCPHLRGSRRHVS